MALSRGTCTCQRQWQRALRRRHDKPIRAATPLWLCQSAHEDGGAHGPAAVAIRLAPPPGCWMQAPARGTASVTALTPAMYTLKEEGMLPGRVSSITPVVWSSNSNFTPCAAQQRPRALCSEL